MTELLLESLRSFPPLKESISQINQICASRDTDINALSKVIETDPLLYGELLRAVNAPFYSFKNEIKSVKQAVSLFGISMIRGFCLAIAIKKHTYTDLSAYNITPEQWIALMQRQQQFLYLWLMKEDREALNQLGALSFMLEIGRLVCAYALMFSDNVYTFTQTDPIKLALEEQNIIELSGDVLAGELFKQWFYEPDFINLFTHSLAPQDANDPRLATMLYITRSLFTLDGVQPFERIEPLIRQHGFTREFLENAYNNLN